MQAYWKKLPSTSEWSPDPRWGHTSCAVGTNVFVFGGTGSKLFNDCAIFDTVKSRWSKPDVIGTPPAPRFGHSATVLPDGKILLFGGRGSSRHYADIFIFDTEKCAWVRSVLPAKNFPESRAGHTTVLTKDGTKMIMFGGHSNHYKYFNNVFILDIASLTWSKPQVSGEFPPTCGGHCSCIFNNQMLVYGGYDGKKYYNTLYSLNLDNFMWSKLEPTGTLPKARSGHSATMLDNKLIIFGGCGSDSNFLNDVQVLRLPELVWEQPALFGLEPAPRFRHTSTLVGGCTLFIYAGTGGGLLMSDVTQLDVESPAPAPHVTASTSAHTAESERKVELLDVSELKRLYLATMTSLVAEKQQLADYQESTSRMKKDMSDAEECISKEKALRVAAEEKLIEEQNKKIKVDQCLMQLKAEQDLRIKSETRVAQLQKTVKKHEKSRLELEEQLRAEQQRLAKVQKEMEELKMALAAEKNHGEELKRALSNEKDNAALREELETLRTSNAHLLGQALDDLSLEVLDNLEVVHNQAFQVILETRNRLSANLMKQKQLELETLHVEKQVLEDFKGKYECKLKDMEVELERKMEELHVTLNENSRLAEKALRFEGGELDDLSLEQLVEHETMHHEGLKKVSMARQAHMQRELAVLRREKEALQEQKLCIVCTARPSNAVLMPCRHASMCFHCSSLLQKCPICRADIQKRIETF